MVPLSGAVLCRVVRCGAGRGARRRAGPNDVARRRPRPLPGLRGAAGVQAPGEGVRVALAGWGAGRREDEVGLPGEEVVGAGGRERRRRRGRFGSVAQPRDQHVVGDTQPQVLSGGHRGEGRVVGVGQHRGRPRRPRWDARRIGQQPQRRLERPGARSVVERGPVGQQSGGDGVQIGAVPRRLRRRHPRGRVRAARIGAREQVGHVRGLRQQVIQHQGGARGGRGPHHVESGRLELIGEHHEPLPAIDELGQPRRGHRPGVRRVEVGHVGLDPQHGVVPVAPALHQGGASVTLGRLGDGVGHRQRPGVGHHP